MVSAVPAGLRMRPIIVQFCFLAVLMLAACERQPVEKHVKTADRLREMGKYEEAALEYDAALKIEPDNIRVHYKLANMYRESLNDKDKAIYHFQQVVRLDPKYAKAWEKMAQLYEKKHDQASVIHTLEQAMKADAFHDKPEKKKEMEDWLAELKAEADQPQPQDVSLPEPSLEQLPGD